MRFFETVNHKVKDEAQVEEILYLVTGEYYTGEQFERAREAMIPGVGKEIFPAEWKRFTKTDRVGAIKLYRELTGCGLREARDVVYGVEGGN